MKTANEIGTGKGNVFQPLVLVFITLLERHSC